MSKFLDPQMGCWVIKCDWKDPETGAPCSLGADGGPAMFVDPHAAQKPDVHFQCGRHHGIIPQAEKPEFQVPKDHKLYKDEIRAGVDKIGVEEVEEDE